MFISKCLQKNATLRSTTAELLNHSFILQAPPHNAIAEIFLKSSELVTSFSDQSNLKADPDPAGVQSKKESMNFETHKKRPSNVTEGIIIPSDTNKGSIISSKTFRTKLNQISSGNDIDLLAIHANKGHFINSGESEKTSLLLLKIKRSASKVEKLKPGLTQLVVPS